MLFTYAGKRRTDLYYNSSSVGAGFFRNSFPGNAWQAQP